MPRLKRKCQDSRSIIRGLSGVERVRTNKRETSVMMMMMVMTMAGSGWLAGLPGWLALAGWLGWLAGWAEF